jgi:hypothetical protein
VPGRSRGAAVEPHVETVTKARTSGASTNCRGARVAAPAR